MNNKNKIKLLLQEFMNGAQSPVIIGGHFALANDPADSTSLIPAIWQDCEDEKTSQWMKNHPYMSHFPTETFNMSVDLLKEYDKAKLLLLINDWQQVRETTVSKATLRASYYLENRLPLYFCGIGLMTLGVESLFEENKNDVRERIFYPPQENTYHNSFYWSELKLRNKFDNRAEYKSCSLKNGCAQEFTPLLDDCEKAGVDKLICMIPATCAYPILEATREFKMARDGKMDVICVFIEHSLSLEKFWDASAFINGEKVLMKS